MTTRAAVVAEALSWLRTPYHHQGDVKGVGVDCAMLLVRVYAVMGMVPPSLDPRPYPREWHLHRSTERYMGWLEQYGKPTETPQPGDVALYKFGRCYSHGAIVVDENTVVHSYLQLGVTLCERNGHPLQDRDVKYYTLWS